MLFSGGTCDLSLSDIIKEKCVFHFFPHLRNFVETIKCIKYNIEILRNIVLLKSYLNLHCRKHLAYYVTCITYLRYINFNLSHN